MTEGLSRFQTQFGKHLRILCLLGAAGVDCAHSPWPEEPGVPVELARSRNVDAADTFLSAVANRRRTANLSAPITAPLYQSEIQVFAEDLQAGKTSVRSAERAVGAWAHATYRRDVKTFVLDCATGSAMLVPPDLLEVPVVEIAYAAAHFRPRSLPQNQCAIIGVMVVGSERIEAVSVP